jgi:uncharacterized protein (TIGR02172 family)
VFAWENDSILKLFHPAYDAAQAQREANHTRIAHAAGLSVPAVNDTVQINGQHGIIFERIDGDLMMNRLRRQPWTVIRMARLLADLHIALHQSRATELPSLRDRLNRKIQQVEVLSPPIKERVLQRLEQLPDDTVICHGDFHPENIILNDKRAVVIDWVDATAGHPLADVTRTALILDSIEPTTGNRFLSAFARLARSVYLKRYLARSGQFTQQQLDTWWLPVAAARLVERVEGEESWLIEGIERRLAAHD